MSGGSGFSGTHGVAGFPNGEIYRVDTASPKLNLARLFYRQMIGFSGLTEKIASAQNSLAEEIPVHRMTLMLGKFSVDDVFDQNAYTGNPRTQFMNWSLMNNGAWDYAADVKGYTWGIFTEYNQERWAMRFALTLVPKDANSSQLDTRVLQAHSENFEFEYRYVIDSKPGKARFLAYSNHTHSGNYARALALNPTQPDLSNAQDFRVKYGFALNGEQELNPDLGFFSRIGWNDGHTESWSFTEIDRTFSAGINLKGNSWNRKRDEIGLALILNALSEPHARYLEAGGYGFLLGDGKLNYAPEVITETYYSYSFCENFNLTGDFQFIHHPAFNTDRGPVSVYSARAHYEF